MVRFLDASNNVLFESQSIATVAASLTSRQNRGAGMVSGTAGIYVQIQSALTSRLSLIHISEPTRPY